MSEDWNWYCASINGFGDAIFESTLDLALGELPHTIRVRKYSALQAKPREDGRAMIPCPIPWLPIGVGAVDAEEEGIIQSSAIITIIPASTQIKRAMNEIYQDAGKRKSNLTIVQSDVPKNLKR